MDYKYLKGKTVTISGKKYTIDKIEEKIINPFSQECIYIVNGIHRFSQADITLSYSALKRVEKRAELDKANFIVKFLRRLGFFMFSLVNMGVKRYGTVMGVRSYGYHKCGLFLEVNLGNKTHTFEFVWNDKDSYETGVLPFVNCPLKKIF